MCWFHIVIAQIALELPPPLSNGQTWKKSVPNHPGKPVHPPLSSKGNAHLETTHFKMGFPLREVILQMYGIAIWWTEAQVDGSVFHVWSFHGLRPWALILNDWEAALRRLRVDVWWWGSSSSSCGRENLKFREWTPFMLPLELIWQF